MNGLSPGQLIPADREAWIKAAIYEYLRAELKINVLRRRFPEMYQKVLKEVAPQRVRDLT